MTSRIDVGLSVKALGGREFEGYGSISGNVDLGGDIVMPGAFQKSLSEHKADGTLPVMFWMHQPDKVPGRWTEMREDSNGLYVKGELADTPLGNEMKTLLDMKAVRGLSIGYAAEKIDFDRKGNRLLQECKLFEVSIVSLAMNPMAKIKSAELRISESGEYVPTEDEQQEAIRIAIAEGKKNAERSLRDAGYSRKTAQSIVAQHFEGSGVIPGSDPVGQRDAEPMTDEAKAVLESIERLQSAMLKGIF